MADYDDIVIGGGDTSSPLNMEKRLQFIEPLSEGTLWADHLKEKGPGVHNLNFYVRDVKEVAKVFKDEELKTLFKLRVDWTQFFDPEDINQKIPPVYMLEGEEIVKGYGNYCIIRTNFVSKEQWKYPKAFTDRFGTYLFSDGVAKGIFEVVEKKEKGIIHIVGDKRMSMYELAMLAGSKNVGKTTLDEINSSLEELGNRLGIGVETFQSNHEGAIVDKIQQDAAMKNGLIINPAAFTCLQLSNAFFKKSKLSISNYFTSKKEGGCPPLFILLVSILKGNERCVQEYTPCQGQCGSIF